MARFKPSGWSNFVFVYLYLATLTAQSNEGPMGSVFNLATFTCQCQWSSVQSNIKCMSLFSLECNTMNVHCNVRCAVHTIATTLCPPMQWRPNSKLSYLFSFLGLLHFSGDKFDLLSSNAFEHFLHSAGFIWMYFKCVLRLLNFCLICLNLLLDTLNSSDIRRAFESP